MNKKNIYTTDNQELQFSLSRRDIVDRNGILISRNINTFHAAVNPKLIKDKKNFLLKLRLNFPELNTDEILKKLNKGKYFRIKKRINQIEKEKLWSLGEKLYLSLFKQECIPMEICLVM